MVAAQEENGKREHGDKAWWFKHNPAGGPLRQEGRAGGDGKITMSPFHFPAYFVRLSIQAGTKVAMKIAQMTRKASCEPKVTAWAWMTEPR